MYFRGKAKHTYTTFSCSSASRALSMAWAPLLSLWPARLALPNLTLSFTGDFEMCFDSWTHNLGFLTSKCTWDTSRHPSPELTWLLKGQSLCEQAQEELQKAVPLKRRIVLCVWGLIPKPTGMSRTMRVSWPASSSAPQLWPLSEKQRPRGRAHSAGTALCVLQL